MIKKTFALLGILIIAAGVFLYLNFGDIAKNTAEKIATNALGVKVRISSLDISLKEKQVRVNNLRISNPPGYKKSHAVTTDEIVIGLNTASKKLIDFKDIRVNGSTVNLEVTEKGSNLTDLKKLASRKKQKESVGSEQIRVIVRNMVFGASTLNPSFTLLKGDIPSITIPSVRISNIGQRGNGALAQDAVSQIMRQYLTIAQREARQAGMFKGIESTINNTVNDAIKDTTKEIENKVNDVTKDFKKLFN